MEERPFVGTLVLKVLEAKGLGTHPNINPYLNVRVVRNGTEDPLTKQRTAVARLTRDPVWNVSFTFPLSDFQLDHLYFRLWDKRKTANLSLGDFALVFTSLDSARGWSSDMWVDIANGSGQVKLSLDYTPKGAKMDLGTMPLTEYAKVLYANDPQKLKTQGPVKGLHEMVSLKKKRFYDGKFDLDLAYITDRIIAMGFPSEGVESMYRNKMKDTQDFLAHYHRANYKVYNLCSERSYAANKFVSLGYYPFDDHNAPTLAQIKDFCNDAEAVLDRDKKNVIAVHCKAGKGRTGTMICSLLCYKYNIPAELSMSFYADRRTYNNKGVTIPSQIRFVRYFDTVKHKLRRGEYNPDRPLKLSEFKITNLPDNLRLKFCVSCKHTKTEVEFKEYSKVLQQQQPKALSNFIFDLKSPRPAVINMETKFFVYDLANPAKPFFFFWLHTDFVKSSQWELDATQLDKLANVEQYEGLKISLTFDAVLQTAASVGLEKRRRPSNAMPVRGNSTLTLASSDSKVRPSKTYESPFRRSDSGAPGHPSTPSPPSPPSVSLLQNHPQTVSVSDYDTLSWLHNSDPPSPTSPISPAGSPLLFERREPTPMTLITLTETNTTTEVTTAPQNQNKLGTNCTT